MSGTLSRLTCLAWLLTSCATPAATPKEPLAADADACQALLTAAPSHWAERLPPVFQLGQAAEPRLIDLVMADSTAPGAPAAIAVLGRLGSERATVFLCCLVTERTALATEAALALGELKAPGASATLQACVLDRFADATLRTASACALVRLGERKAATPLLEAVLLAGTPAGQQSALALGLPAKTRWALERYFVQRLLQQEGALELLALLDTDAPWPTLVAVTARIVEWLERP